MSTSHTDIELGGLPFRAPERGLSKRRPIEAYKRFRLLIADKEDTEQVFHIGDALSGAYFEDMLFNAIKSGEAIELATKHQSLIPFLDDHEGLERFEDGTLGHAYLTFMRREGLTASGLEDEDRKFRPTTHPDLIQWNKDRHRDIHDLMHVLTGYSRGALGELCTLAFTYGLNRGGLGDWFIAFMGTLQMKQWFPDLPVRKAFKEAIGNGRGAHNFIYRDIDALFAMPISEVRRELNIQPIPIYQDVSARITARTEADNDPTPYGAVASG